MSRIRTAPALEAQSAAVSLAALSQHVRLCLSAVLAVGCLAKTDGTDAGASGADSQAQQTDEVTAPEMQTCKLTESAAHPTVTLTGRVCGETVSVATRAGAVIHLGRSQPTDPRTEVRVIEVVESARTGDVVELANAGFLVNLAFETGPEVASSVSTHALTSGVFSLCGFGTVVMQPGPVTFELGGVDDGAASGDITLTLSGLLVGGFSERHGESRVQLCGGELELTLQGRFIHQ